MLTGLTPEQQAIAVAERKKLEADAAKQALQKPTEEVFAESQEDVELLAMLAGSTAQLLKSTKFSDNTMATTASKVLNPAEIVGALSRKGPNGQPTPVLRNPQPGVPVQQARPIQVQQQNIVDLNDPQLELELFRKMNMTDVYNMLSDIKDEIKAIKATVNKIEKFMDAISTTTWAFIVS